MFHDLSFSPLRLPDTMAVDFSHRLAQGGISYRRSPSPSLTCSRDGSVVRSSWFTISLCSFPELDSFLPILPLCTFLLILLPPLEYLQMPCLLREHLLCVSDETSTRLVLDFVLRYYRRFLGLDDARAALLELRWPGG